MCQFDMVPNRTNDLTGSKTIRIVSTKAKKKGFTVALCANGAGEKLPVLMIFKEKGGKLGPRVSKTLTLPPNVAVTASQNGWMTGNLYHWWLNNVYGSNMAPRRLFLVDNYKAHLTEESKTIVENCNSELLFIPAGCTSLVQPMDVSVNRPFKQRMRDLWVQWFAGHTVHGNPKQPSRQDVINWVSDAWNSIKAEMIQEPFVLCGITAAVDCSENKMTFSHVPRVVLEESDEEPSEDNVEEDESPDQHESAEPDEGDEEMVSGDDFEGFDSDVDPSD